MLYRFSITFPFIAAVFTLANAVVSGSVSARHFEEIRTFVAEEAHQGIAVDEHFIYAIDSRSIGKYDKSTGKAVARWVDPKGGPDHSPRQRNGSQWAAVLCAFQLSWNTDDQLG